MARVTTAHTRVVEVGEPFDGGLYRGQTLKFGGSQSAGAGDLLFACTDSPSSCLGIIEFLNRAQSGLK